jgi:hypothetical protein
MSDAAPSTAPAPVETRLDAASMARLRALSRPGIAPREFIRSVSPVEIAALIGLVLLAACALLAYSFVILPDQVEFVQLSGQVSDNNTKIEELRGTITDPTPVIQQVDSVRTSLDEFRSGTLKARRAGRLAIVETVGRLTSETGVRLSSAVGFSTRDPLAEALDENVRREEGENAIRSFPSLAVDFSVSGNYDQLRRFISRLEASDQFLLIDSINLATDESDTGEPQLGPRRSAPTVSGVVTLRILMTAYFQPESTGAGQ